MMLFAIVLLLLILVLLLAHRSSTKQNFRQLEREITALREELARTATQAPASTVARHEETTATAKPEKAYPQPGFEATSPAFQKEEWLAKPSSPEQKKVAATEEKPLQPATETVAAAKEILKPEKPSFFERNPDLEKFIGENLVSKIGIAILVLAIGYFVKFAIDNDWIGTIGRVAVGIVCGGILIGIAHKLRNSYHAFSSVLAGGGLATFYFTITLAFQQYQLFSQTAAFVIMLVITAFAVLLALLYNRQELAMIALTGGFAAPLLVSHDGGNYVTLFVYLIVLNGGLLLIAYNKSWRIVNATAFAFTAILFASWLYSLPAEESTVTYRNAFLFAAVFYILFLVISIANNIKENKQFLAFDFSILLANTGLFFTAGLYCLHHMNATIYDGLFSAGVAVFNLVLSYFLFRKQNIDNNILYLLIGITLTFVSLTAPLQLQGHFITLFWASETVLLSWLYIKSKINIIQYASGLIFVCMLVSLAGDWINVYSTLQYTGNSRAAQLPVIFNRGFVTSIYAAAASYMVYELLRRNSLKFRFANVVFFLITALLIVFVAGNLETGYQFTRRFQLSHLALLYGELFSFLFVATITIPNGLWNPKWQSGLIIISLVVYFFMLPATNQLLHTLTWDKNNSLFYLFIAHWFVALLTGIFFYRLTSFLTKTDKESKEKITWLISLAIVAFLSAEIYYLTVSLFYSKQTEETLNRVFVKAVLPVLWGVCSFACMWLGMKYKYKTLRVVSLSLFTATLVKLFAYDISNIPVAGKIIAFFCLGVLLLIISFMYQRLKKIIIEDEAKPA